MDKDFCNRILAQLDDVPWKLYDVTSPSGIKFHFQRFILHLNNPNSLDVSDEIAAFVEANIPQYERRTLGGTAINKYAPGDFAERHRDAMEYRRYTLLVQLSDPSSYEGGDLIIDDKIVSREQGAMFLFDAQVNWHSVSPISSGVRYSLVQWSYEDPIDNPTD
jgi:predicted 2-oxoglutarate/Fe(II)-dependent dioxygenase YbiX